MSTDTKAHNASVWSYTIGFVLSICLTSIAYLLIRQNEHTKTTLVWYIVGLAMAQLVVQLVFFIHLGTDRKSRWNKMAMLFMFLVISILVFGSMWIMNSLNYNHPAMNTTDKEVLTDEIITR